MNRKRLDTVLAAMTRHCLDSLIVTDPSHIAYLTGYRPDPGERLAVLFLKKDGQASFFTNELFPTPDLGCPVYTHKDTENPLKDIIPAVPEGTVGIDGSWQGRFILPLLDALPGTTRPVLGSLPLQEVRMIKSEDELALMREASRRNDLVIEGTIRSLHEGIREDEVTEILKRLYTDHGLPVPAFAIVSFGAHAADPHHAGGTAVLKKGDSVVIDIGSPWKGYHSDMTRTVFCGEPTDEQKKVYETVLEAHLSAMDTVAPGIPLKEIDRAARSVIENAGYGPYFTHRTGHNIGMDVHEYPDVSAVSDVVAQPGMVFSIEPGIYLPGRFGVRIENLVEVTEDGHRSLNSYTRELQTV